MLSPRALRRVALSLPMLVLLAAATVVFAANEIRLKSVDEARHLADLAAATCDADRTPELVKATSGLLPEAAAAQLERAEIVVQIEIQPGGTAKILKVIKAPNPDFGLPKLAEDIVGQWRYKPAAKEGKPVACAFVTRVMFDRAAKKGKIDPLGRAR